MYQAEISYLIKRRYAWDTRSQPVLKVTFRGTPTTITDFEKRAITAAVEHFRRSENYPFYVFDKVVSAILYTATDYMRSCFVCTGVATT